MSDTPVTSRRSDPSPWLRSLFGGVLLASAHVAALAVPDAQALLAASDAIRNPAEPFAISVALTDYRDGPNAEPGTQLTVYSKIDPTAGQYRSLIRYEAPARDVGKLMLKNGNDLWFYDASTKASVRISPQQRLLGQASNGDVVTVNLAHDYKASVGAEEDVKDGSQQMRHSVRLDLKAMAADVTYDRIEMWVDAATNAPIKARFYSESNSLLKTAYYRRYEQQLGAQRPTEVVIIDGLNSKWVTVMRYTNYRTRTIPDAWFQRDYLPRFKDE